ncbi:hypothetical protein LIER_31136 [Lithospermum erythrorhizon]|uniref:RNase H type-1 domain-containing protein n=1 Tax=Lithospermum erythrorhizon TaxID=34254 RepID=A0AAV3RPZ5_LITER
MSGVDSAVALHRIHVDPPFHPIKQRKRTFSEEKNVTIREEIANLMKTSAIRELQFPRKISNNRQVFIRPGDFCSQVETIFRVISHSVFTDQPLKKILTSPALSGWMTTWAAELSEFAINYVPRTSIKAHVLVDFLIECTTRQPLKVGRPREPQEPAQIPKWILYVGGARNNKGVGAVIMIQGPDKLKMEYALRFSFEATNNEAEYEAMIAGLMLVKHLGMKRVIVRGDSNLVMDQINGEC